MLLKAVELYGLIRIVLHGVDTPDGNMLHSGTTAMLVKLVALNNQCHIRLAFLAQSDQGREGFEELCELITARCHENTTRLCAMFTAEDWNGLLSNAMSLLLPYPFAAAGAA